MRAVYFSLAALIAAICIKTFGNGMLSALLPLDIEARGMGTATAGWVGTSYGAGFLVGCIFAPDLVRRVGHIRVFAAFSSIFGTIVLAFPAIPDPVAWSVLRGLTGFAMASLSTVADGWVSARCTPEIRGRVMSVYMLFSKIAILAGPAALSFMTLNEPWPYMLAASVFMLAIVPVALSTSAAPSVPAPGRLTPARLYSIAPAAVIGCFGIGMLNGAVTSLVPLYGTQSGLSTAHAALLVSALQGGALLMQWPIGWWSDKRDRRLIIMGATGVTCAASLILALWIAPPAWLIFAVSVVWGGASLSIYAICIAHGSDKAGDERLIIPLCASLLLVWASGATIGPVIASLLMEWWGPSALFAYSTVVAALITAFIALRIYIRPASPGAGSQPFVNVPATSPTVATLDPRAPGDQVIREDPPPGK